VKSIFLSILESMLLVCLCLHQHHQYDFQSAIRPLTSISCDMISLYLMERFQWDFNHQSGHCWKGY